MNITLHIERLIVDEGFMSRDQRMILQAAVESELARLLTAGGLSEALQTDGAFPSIRPLSMAMKEGSRPAEVGSQIARTVYGGLGK